jgi:hypothetical protein
MGQCTRGSAAIDVASREVLTQTSCPAPDFSPYAEFFSSVVGFRNGRCEGIVHRLFVREGEHFRATNGLS